jgi:hypothetical protein
VTNAVYEPLASKGLRLHGGEITSQSEALSYCMVQQFLLADAPQQIANTANNNITHSGIHELSSMMYILQNKF